MGGTDIGHGEGQQGCAEVRGVHDPFRELRVNEEEVRGVPVHTDMHVVCGVRPRLVGCVVRCYRTPTAGLVDRDRRPVLPQLRAARSHLNCVYLGYAAGKWVVRRRRPDPGHRNAAVLVDPDRERLPRDRPRGPADEEPVAPIPRLGNAHQAAVSRVRRRADLRRVDGQQRHGRERVPCVGGLHQKVIGHKRHRGHPGRRGNEHAEAYDRGLCRGGRLQGMIAAAGLVVELGHEAAAGPAEVQQRRDVEPPQVIEVEILLRVVGGAPDAHGGTEIAGTQQAQTIRCHRARQQVEQAGLRRSEPAEERQVGHQSWLTRRRTLNVSWAIGVNADRVTRRA